MRMGNIIMVPVVEITPHLSFQHTENVNEEESIKFTMLTP